MATWTEPWHIHTVLARIAFDGTSATERYACGEAHRVSKRELEGGGVPFNSKLQALSSLRDAGGLQLIEDFRGCLWGWRWGVLGFMPRGRDTTEGESHKGEGQEGHGSQA